MMRYGIATLLKKYPDGYEFTDADTPLHLTHVDVLEVDIDSEKFITGLRRHLIHEQKFSITPTADTFYGANKDIPVTDVALCPELQAFHARLIHYLESIHATFDNPQYLKDRYGPHISIYGPRRVEIGKPIVIKSISVGNKRTDIENPPNRIISTIPLH